jgi:hypothetical protein
MPGPASPGRRPDDEATMRLSQFRELSDLRGRHSQPAVPHQ